SVQITVKDAIGAVVSGTFSIIINPAPIVAPGALPGAVMGTAYAQVLTVSYGTRPYTTFAVSGFNAGGTGLAAPTINLGAGTITLAGTPNGSGTVTFTVTVTDAAGATALQVYSFTVSPPVSPAVTQIIAVGTDSGVPATVNVYAAQTMALKLSM